MVSEGECGVGIPHRRSRDALKYSGHSGHAHGAAAFGSERAAEATEKTTAQTKVAAAAAATTKRGPLLENMRSRNLLIPLEHQQWQRQRSRRRHHQQQQQRQKQNPLRVVRNDGTLRAATDRSFGVLAHADAFGE